MAQRSRSKIKRWYGPEDPDNPPKQRTYAEYQEMIKRRISWHNKVAEQQSECIVEFPWTYEHEERLEVLPVEEGDKLYNLRLKVTHKGVYKNWAGTEYHPMIMVDEDGLAYRWIATARPGSKVHEIEVGDTLILPYCSVKETIPDQGLTCIFYPSRNWRIVPPNRRIVH